MNWNLDWGGFNNAFAQNAERLNAIPGQLVNSFRQGGQDNALRQYAMNPNDPNAINALAANGDPRMALQARQQQSAQQAAKQEKDTAMIAALARDSKDGPSFDAAVDQVVAMGYPDAAQFKGKFSPGLRSALMAAGGVKEDAPQNPSALIQGYQFRQNLPETERSQFDRYQQNARPQIVGNAESGYGYFDPNSAPAPPNNLPRVSSPDEAAQLPPGSQFMLPDGRIGTVPGGAGGNTSGGFPDPLAPF